MVYGSGRDFESLGGLEMKKIWNGMPNAGTDINDNFEEVVSDYVKNTRDEIITGKKTFEDLHFSSDTEKTPLEIDSKWTANGHYVKMTNGVLSIHVDSIRPKDALTGQPYYTVAKLPAYFKDFVHDHSIEFVWSNINGGESTYGGKVEKDTGNILFYLMPSSNRINSNHRFSIYLTYVPV